MSALLKRKNGLWLPKITLLLRKKKIEATTCCIKKNPKKQNKQTEKNKNLPNSLHFLSQLSTKCLQ